MRQKRKGQFVRKVTAFLLVLVMVLALPIMAQAEDDVQGDTVRIYPWRYGENESRRDIAYEFSGITNQRIITVLEETREFPGAIDMFMPWDMSVRPPVRGDWDYDLFERHLGGQLTVLYVYTHTPIIFTVHLPYEFSLYDEEGLSELWQFSGRLTGELADHRANEEGLEYTQDELERRVAFDTPGIFLIDDWIQPAIFFIVRDSADSDSTPEPSVPTTAPNLATASSWAHESINSALEHGLIPQGLQSHYTQATTRAEFAALAVALYETITGREITERAQFNDTTDVNVQKMGGLGVVNGVGGGNFAPNRTITRQEAAVMLARLAYAIGQPLPPSAPTFADNADISAWAVDGVGQMQAAGIMSGVGNNNFAPDGTYTREQSIVSMLRLFDLLS